MTTTTIAPTTDLNDDLTKQVKAKKPRQSKSATGDGDFTTVERRRLTRLERVIEAHLAGEKPAGDALIEIRDSRLYRDTHDTFEAYLDERFGISRSWAYRLIDAARVAAVVSPIGDTIVNEAQARELAPLLDQPDKLRKAVEVASANGPLTAAKVRVAVAALTKTRTARSPLASKPNRRRSDTRVRDLPGVAELLAEAPFTELERIVGTQPVIRLNNRRKTLESCTLDDLANAVAEQRGLAKQLREQARAHEQSAQTLRKVEVALRPLFAATRKPLRPKGRPRNRQTPPGRS